MDQTSGLNPNEYRPPANKMPVVDIIIPVYNAARHLRETLKSANEQSYPFIHIYIIDDCSPDDSSRIINDFEFTVPVTVCRHEVNRGLSAARNTGIRQGRGEFIGILDADDLWDPNKIACQVERFMRSDSSLGVVSSDFRVIDEFGSANDPNTYDYCRDISPMSRHLLVPGNVVSGGSAALIRRACIAECGGFDESLTACEDWEMWYRISRSHSIEILRKPIVFVRRYPTSMQGDTSRMLRNRLKIYMRFMSDLPDSTPSGLRFVEGYLLKECLASLRYLPRTTAKVDLPTALHYLGVQGIHDGSIPMKYWASAYRRYRLTEVFYSIWRGIDKRFNIKERVRKQRLLSRIFRAARWRVHAISVRFLR